MKVEAVLKNGQYVIPFLEKIKLKKPIIFIEIDDKLFSESIKKSDEYKKFEKLSGELEDNELLKLIMDGMPKNYHYKETDLTDREIWLEETRSKYE